jgi:hypothetical protein
MLATIQAAGRRRRRTRQVRGRPTHGLVLAGESGGHRFSQIRPWGIHRAQAVSPFPPGEQAHAHGVTTLLTRHIAQLIAKQSRGDEGPMHRKTRAPRWHKALRRLRVVFLIIASLAIASLALVNYRPGVTPGVVKAASATIVSDKLDYPPGATVTLTGAGWVSGEVVHLFVNDNVGNTWSLKTSALPGRCAT